MRERDRVQLKTVEARNKAIDLNPPRCRLCSKVIPKPRRYNNKVAYCSPEHAREGRQLYENQRRQEQRVRDYAKKLSEEELEAGLYPDDQIRRGALYDKVKAEIDPRVIDDWIDRKMTDVEMKNLLVGSSGSGASFTGLGMVRRALFNDRLLGIAAIHHHASDRHQRMLGPADTVMKALADKDPKLYGAKLRTLVAAFVAWRHEFFPEYHTKDVHRRWIESILDTIYTGGRSLILSPPRHGKTELLIHFCVWLIIRNPNIRILWVGPNTDIAENCIGLVKAILETHDGLKAAYLAKGQSWSPLNRRSGNLWQTDKFTVQTRTQPKKQPTMWAAGVLGALLSIDADFAVVDDPADPDKSFTPGGRAKIDNWFKVKVISRKMDHTGLVVIASRVHILDLFAQFLESALWNVIVDKAHDVGVCGLDLFTDHPGAGVTEGCVLFPEMNPLQYLRDQHDVVGDALFEMMYLNQPRPDGTLIFDPDIIRHRCLHPGRDLGLGQIQGSFRLIAGLDPAAKGVQASVLWAFQVFDNPTTGKPDFLYHLVDLETQQGGGLEGAERIMRHWQKLYGANLWVVEDNSFQGIFFTDLRFRRFLHEEGITMKPAQTGRNKFDQHLGVSSMAADYHEGRIILPYATLEAKRKSESLIRQLVNFTGDTGPVKAGTSDIRMASWFPFATIIRRWKKEAMAAASPAPAAAPANSYPGYVGSDYAELPWPAIGYPTETLGAG